MDFMILLVNLPNPPGNPRAKRRPRAGRPAMPIDRVKVDQSLIAGIETSEKSRVIVQAVIHLIKGVGCEVVAEAVETVSQADILRAMGCDTVQGFVYSPPMMEREFLSWTQRAEGRAKSVA